jgi:hypothetical protein
MGASTTATARPHSRPGTGARVRSSCAQQIATRATRCAQPGTGHGLPNRTASGSPEPSSTLPNPKLATTTSTSRHEMPGPVTCLDVTAPSQHTAPPATSIDG